MKNTLKYLASFFLGLVLFAMPALAQQYTLTQTTLSANITTGQTSFNVASATNITTAQNTNQTDIYVDRELMQVVSVSGTTVNVIRGVSGTQASAHASGAMVLAGSPPAFQNYDPEGYCNTAPATGNPSGQGVVPPALPTINTRTGNQWLCSTITHTWVPGFGNYTTDAVDTTAVASVAGSTLPSGPLFHVTGTNAITGWTIPVGCNATTVGGCRFTIVPDAVFTWTAAGNIAVASSALPGAAVVVKHPITFFWDASLGKWLFQPGA